MKRFATDAAILSLLVLCVSALHAQPAQVAVHILIGAGKTYVLDSAVDIERISIASPEVAESVPVSNRSVVINGKAPGETSAVIWFSDGTRKLYDVSVMAAAAHLDAAKAQIEKEFSGAVQMTGDANAVYLTGKVQTIIDSERAQSIAATIGKVVNLLKVEVPAQEQQILLKVKFADVDRSKSLSLGANILGSPSGIPFNVTTGANNPSRFSNITSTGSTATSTYTLSDALNLLMFDPHLNLLATIQALEGANVLQILDEPNLLAMNGHTATFLAGGEFPYPTLQGGGSGVGQVTISFREFGIKLKFTPVITPRGTIRLHLAPEVSSLDFADALTVEGGTVPALTTRRVETEVELEDGQSFAIAGLLDRSTTETLSKIPGLADIPILGKLFTSKVINRSNSELIVIVTPELVSPIPKDQPVPDLPMPRTFLEGKGVVNEAPRTPGVDKTGQPPAKTARSEMPVQEMEKLQREEQVRAQQEGSAGSTSSSGSGAVTPNGISLAPGAMFAPVVAPSPTIQSQGPTQ